MGGTQSELWRLQDMKLSNIDSNSEKVILFNSLKTLLIAFKGKSLLDSNRTLPPV